MCGGIVRMDLAQIKIKKPFSSFKWRWMEVTPVESFNRPDLIIGITRAMMNCEGLPASDPQFLSELEIIQSDLLGASNLNLVPEDPSRNVIRRQGRYWRGMGLLAQSRGRSIRLTDLGRKLATGQITNDDFAAHMVLRHSLPNDLIDKSEIIELWANSSIKIYPLKLILTTLSKLRELNYNEGYITPKELYDVIIPLSIIDAKISSSDYALGIMQYRADPTSAEHLPDCVEAANDKRMAREHLLFLLNYGLLDTQKTNINSSVHSERFFVNEAGLLFADSASKLPTSETFTSNEVNPIGNGLNQIIDLGAVRTKRIVEVTLRPNQSKFRQIVLENFSHMCLLTGETSTEVLDARHIIAVKNGGKDSIDNGLCLRTDIHKLFDIGKLRISAGGQINLSPDIQKSPSYGNLPTFVHLPMNINRDYLRRRNAYGETLV